MRSDRALGGGLPPTGHGGGGMVERERAAAGEPAVRPERVR
ncbi:hypothetical protein [Streptomyces sp. NPDC048357]